MLNFNAQFCFLPLVLLALGLFNQTTRGDSVSVGQILSNEGKDTTVASDQGPIGACSSKGL